MIINMNIWNEFYSYDSGILNVNHYLREKKPLLNKFYCLKEKPLLIIVLLVYLRHADWGCDNLRSTYCNTDNKVIHFNVEDNPNSRTTTNYHRGSSQQQTVHTQRTAFARAHHIVHHDSAVDSFNFLRTKRYNTPIVLISELQAMCKHDVTPLKHATTSTPTPNLSPITWSHPPMHGHLRSTESSYAIPHRQHNLFNTTTFLCKNLILY